jgi:hypothetical protein
MFDELYPEAADTALNSAAQRVAPAPDVPWFKGAWSAIGKAVPRAGAEMGRAGTSLLTPEAVGAMDAPSMFSPGKSTKPQLAEELREQDAAIRDAIKEMTPDAQTTGVASMVLHDVARFVGKAAAYSALGGAPAAVAGMTLDEGANEALRRMDEGVDPATAAKLGAVKGVASGVAVALPVAGKTIAQTLGLAAMGGPGGYIAEQATAREILESADYSKEAAQIDPFDPLGLGVSFFGSLLFGAGAHAARGVKARSDAKLADQRTIAADQPPGEQTPVAQAARTYTQEQVDAAHVSILQAQREGSALHAREDIAAAGKHAEALDRASEQLAMGRWVEVADMAPVDGARAVEALRPTVDRIGAIVRELQARVEPPEVARANLMRFMENSKAVDAEGKPLVVYHGTAQSFDGFDIDRAGSAIDAGKLGEGIYFSESNRWAASYAENASKGGDGANVVPVHLSLKNPVVLSGEGGYLPKLEELSRYWGLKELPTLDAAQTPNPEWAKAFTAEAKARGFDGVILPSKFKETEYVVFSPEQAKSAIGNSGKFDPNSASLTDAIEPPKVAAPESSTGAGSKPKNESDVAAPAADYAAREADTIAQTDPDMLVMMEGMEQPVRASDLLAEAKAMADQEIADAPLMKIAAECALRG